MDDSIDNSFVPDEGSFIDNRFVPGEMSLDKVIEKVEDTNSCTSYSGLHWHCFFKDVPNAVVMRL